MRTEQASRPACLSPSPHPSDYQTAWSLSKAALARASRCQTRAPGVSVATALQTPWERPLLPVCSAAQGQGAGLLTGGSVLRSVCARITGNLFRMSFHSRIKAPSPKNDKLRSRERLCPSNSTNTPLGLVLAMSHSHLRN